MKLQVIVAAIAMVLGTAAYADMTSVTTTTQTTRQGMEHRHHMNQSMHQKRMQKKKNVCIANV